MNPVPESAGIRRFGVEVPVSQVGEPDERAQQVSLPHASNVSRAPHVPWATVAAGWLLVLFGLAVMAAWAHGDRTLLETSSPIVPVWFSTALLLALAGAALVALFRDARRVAIVTCLLLAAVSLVALSENAFHVASGLDAVWRHADERVPLPGRTSAIVAAAFFLAAAAEWLLSEPRLDRRRPAVVVALGAAPLLVGLTVLFDYAIGNANLSTAHSAVRLAPRAAMGLAALGLGVIAGGWRESQRREPGIPGWLPGYAAVTMLLATGAVSSAVRTEEIAHRDQQALLAAGSLHEAVGLELEARRQQFERMAARAEAGLYSAGGTTWQSDAGLMVAHSHDPYMTVYLLDGTLTPRGMVPQHGVGLPSRDQMLASPVRRAALDEAMQTGQPGMSARLAIAPGTRGFVLTAPVRGANRAVTGLIVAELAYEPLLHRILNRSPYAVEIREGEDVVYSQGDGLASDAGTTADFDMAGDAWRLTLKPERGGGGLGGSLSGVLAVFGVLLSVSIGWSLQQARGLAGWARRIHDANDRLSGEVAERQRAEENLRQTTTLQQAILDSANYIIISIDVGGGVRTFNRAAERLLGHSAAHVIDTPIAAFFDADEIERRAAQLSVELGRRVSPGLEAIVARVKPGEPDTSEWTHIGHDGRRFPVELSVNAILDDAGGIVGYLVIAVDISKRRHAELLRRWAEESLRKTEQMLQRVLDSSLSGVLAATAIRDLDGHIDDFEVMLVNQAAERLLGKDAASLVGRTVRAEMPGDVDGSFFDRLVDVVERGQPCDFERASVRDDGAGWFRVIAVPLEDGVAITFENITARKQAEEELARYVQDLEISRDQIHEQSVMLQWQAEELTRARDEALAGSREMERAVKMQADFVSFASHQLRTPLAGIKWLLELALEEPSLDGPGAAELRSYLADSLSSAERLIGLVNDLLDISRLEGGRMAVSSARIDVAALCREVAGELEPNIAQRKHTLAVTNVERPIYAHADPQLVRQVLHNLLSNAVKYTPEGGHVALSLSVDATELQCRVEDSGIGVPEESRARLFEKFFRADNVQTMETEGTGLGLFMVRLILERFGGRVWYQPRETADGSCFTFALPVKEECHVSAETDSDRRGRPSTAPGV